jgi:hypothetical protein
MKKLLLITLSAGLSFGAFAQRVATVSAERHAAPTSLNNLNTARTSAVGSIYELSHITSSDTLTVYTVTSSRDSGYCAGTDAYGDKSFAERYDFNGADSSVEVDGVVTLFAGTVNPSSTKTIVFSTWSVGPQAATTRATLFNSGFPNAVLASLTTPLTAVIPDSVQAFEFATPASNLASFFVGCTINYTSFSGDTIGLFSNLYGERTSNEYNVSGGDTIINNVNATQYSDNTWHDNATDNFQLFYNYYLLPIVKIGSPVGVASVTKRNLTFYGNYPNPATDNTNIKFSLASDDDVTITITDMAGRTVNTIAEKGLTAGMHIINVATTNLASGDYLYIVRTATGNGMASKLTIAK